MPELPEVETIKRVLEPQIRGLDITEIVLNRPEIIAHPGADEFCRALSGQTLARMGRRGKFLIICLTNGSRVIIHLRMTGCLLVAPVGAPAEKHTHLIFRLSGEKELRFSDPRRFGRVWLLQKGEEDTCSGMGKLGIEPFGPEVSAACLRTHFGRRKKAIKKCLLDQDVLAGIGNIYSDEILFAAHIHPARPAASLTGEEWERLAAAIPERLSYFIRKNEITPEEYWQTRGRDYRNTPFLEVYGREGTPCPVCGSVLCRMVIGGRSSIYCPSCQSLPDSGERDGEAAL